MVNKNVEFSNGIFRHYFYNIEHKYTQQHILYIEPNITTVFTAYKSLPDIYKDIDNKIVKKMFIGIKKNIKIYLKNIKYIKLFVNKENKTILYGKTTFFASTLPTPFTTDATMYNNEKNLFRDNIKKSVFKLKTRGNLIPTTYAELIRTSLTRQSQNRS